MIPILAKLPPSQGVMNRTLRSIVTSIVRQHMKYGRADDIMLAVYCSGVNHGAALARQLDAEPTE